MILVKRLFITILITANTITFKKIGDAFKSSAVSNYKCYHIHESSCKQRKLLAKI